MGLLFNISNIAVPLLLLSIKTLLRVYRTDNIGAGQWFCFIVYTLLSNLLFYFMQSSKIYLLVDLAIKLLIGFIPEKTNHFIETKISHLHLEILIDYIRSHLIEKFYIVHSYVTEMALSKMDAQEQRQFKQALFKQLNRETAQETQSPLAKKLQASKQRYENIGISCDILTPDMIEKEKQQGKILKKILSDQNLRRPADKGFHEDEQKKKSSIEKSSFKKKNSYLMQKSSTDLGLDDQDEEIHASPKHHTKKNKPKDSHNMPKYTEVQAIEKKISAIEKKQDLSQDDSLILNKLDVSEYSDMFEDEEEEAKGEPIAKVQSIIEIGTAGSVRLEIYIIELYANSDLRIMSLYGREFQKHKLVSMKAQRHDYYELKLSGGKVDKRRVKFRGNWKEFQKYLVP